MGLLISLFPQNISPSHKANANRNLDGGREKNGSKLNYR